MKFEQIGNPQKGAGLGEGNAKRYSSAPSGQLQAGTFQGFHGTGLNSKIWLATNFQYQLPIVMTSAQEKAGYYESPAILVAKPG